jgi:hypothetical protein
MQAEVEHLDDDQEALAWASSSVRAGVSERCRVWRRHPVWSPRSVAILWILIFISSSAFNVSLALAVRLRWERMAFVMGAWFQGFDYARFQLLARAMPVGLFVLMGGVVAAFCLALYLSLRRRAAAFPAFCGALGLSLAAWLYQLGIPAYVQAISAAHRWRSGLCFALTAGVLSALRWVRSP